MRLGGIAYAKTAIAYAKTSVFAQEKLKGRSIPVSLVAAGVLTAGFVGATTGLVGSGSDQTTHTAAVADAAARQDAAERADRSAREGTAPAEAAPPAPAARARRRPRRRPRRPGSARCPGPS